MNYPKKNRFLQRTEREFQCANSQSDTDENLFLKTMHVIRLFVIFLWTMDKCNVYCTCNCFLFIYLILNFVPTRCSISALHRRDRSAGSSTLFWLQDSPCRFCTPNHYRTKDAEMVPKLIWIFMFARIYLATLSK